MITAVDIGATKTLVAQFDKTLQPVNEIRFETPKDQIDFFHLLVETLQRFSKITTIVIGAPGIIDSNGIILRCGNLPWKNFDLRKVVSQQFQCPVLIENDARLAGLAEVNFLNPVPPLGVYLTISTGIGSGVISHGKIIEGLRSEPGHMVFNFNGGWQAWEDFASGSAIKEQFGRFAKDITDPNDWQKIAHHLSIGLSALIPTLQPDIIIFGGGVGQYVDSFDHFLTEQLKKQLPSFISLPPIIKAKHPQEAVLFGCYHYAQHRQDSITD